VKLIDEESSTFDVARRRAAFRRIQEILKEESPFIALYQQSEIYGVSRRIDWAARPGGHVFLWDTGIVKK
jgi:ABC-type transport system substrate-binding protein